MALNVTFILTKPVSFYNGGAASFIRRSLTNFSGIANVIFSANFSYVPAPESKLLEAQTALFFTLSTFLIH